MYRHLQEGESLKRFFHFITKLCFTNLKFQWCFPHIYSKTLINSECMCISVMIHYHLLDITILDIHSDLYVSLCTM